MHTLLKIIIIIYLVAAASMEKLRNLRSCFKIPHKKSERKAGQGKQIANRFAALLTSYFHLNSISGLQVKELIEW